jgi:hypothetical protein
MIGEYIVVLVGFGLAIAYVLVIRHILNAADDQHEG